MTDDIDADGKRVEDAQPDHLSGSFERDVAPLRPDLYRHALSLTRNHADAEDLVQDTMLKAFRGYDRLRPDTFLKAWLFTIMKNTWISNFRAAGRRPSETLWGDVSDVDFGSVTTAGAVEAGSAESEVLRHEIDPHLVAALGGLSEEMQATVFHVVVEGMLCRDVAKLLGISTNTVLTRMHRSRRALRRSLDKGPGHHRRRADLDPGQAA
jgi:RNA polymerase sigma-70 factor (ECF subfamily)